MSSKPADLKGKKKKNTIERKKEHITVCLKQDASRSTASEPINPSAFSQDFTFSILLLGTQQGKNQQNR